MKLNSRGSWSLIGLLVVVVIIGVATAVYIKGGNSSRVSTVSSSSEMLDSKSEKKTVFGKAIDTGKAESCRQQLDQIRKGIITYKSSGASDENPPTLKDIGLGVSNTYFQCPMAGKKYTYDPATGDVRCPVHTDF